MDQQTMVYKVDYLVSEILKTLLSFLVYLINELCFCPNTLVIIFG